MISDSKAKLHAPAVCMHETHGSPHQQHRLPAAAAPDELEQLSFASSCGRSMYIIWSISFDRHRVVQGDSGGAFLVNVAVDQQHRGQGVGRKLIATAVDTAARRLLAKRLYTHVDCDNEAAWRLYQQQGFDVFDDAQCTLPGDFSQIISTVKQHCLSSAALCISGMGFAALHCPPCLIKQRHAVRLLPCHAVFDSGIVMSVGGRLILSAVLKVD